VALVLAGSLATAAPSVHAAGFSLTASPNPVVLTAPATTGSTTLTWDVTGIPSCQCGVVQVDDGSGTKPIGPVSGKGSMAQTVVYPKVYVFTLIAGQGQPNDQHVSIRVDVQQNGSGGGGNAPSLTLFPTKTLTSDDHYSHTSNDVWCVTNLSGHGLGPDINVTTLGNRIAVGFSHYYDSGSGPFPCEEQADDFYRGGVGFDMSAVNTFAKVHGLASAAVLFRQDTGSVPCIDHIGINSDPWESLTPGSVSILPDGVLPVSPLMAPASPGFLGQADVLAPIALGVGLGGVSPHMHFVFVGRDENLYAQDNNRCDSTISTLVLHLVGAH
jgi:hypothetical protein